MSELYESTSKQEWEQARRTAFIQHVLGAFTERSVDLPPFFEEVRQKLHLLNARYLGLQEVPQDHIVGSVGRSRDFTRTFCPREAGLQDCWQRVNQLMTKGSGAPPIELHKVGQVYFVRDGNHRVSVAKQHNVPTIEAYVWEYETRAPVEPAIDIDDLLCKAAHGAFLERTNIDCLRPELRIEFTQPDGYREQPNLNGRPGVPDFASNCAICLTWPTTLTTNWPSAGSTNGWHKNAPTGSLRAKARQDRGVPGQENQRQGCGHRDYRQHR